MKYLTILLIIGVFRCSFASSDDSSVNKDEIEFQTLLIYDLLEELLFICQLNSSKVILLNNLYTLETFNVLTDLQPNISVVSFTDYDYWKKIYWYRLKELQVDAVIVAVEVDDAWKEMDKFFYKWPYNRDCLVYIFPVPLNDCRYYGVLQDMMQFYFSKAYFICLKDNLIVRVYTHDPYGDTSPPFWNKINQELFWGKQYTFYERHYEEDMSELCPGFDFKRSELDNQPNVIAGVLKNTLESSDEELEEVLYDHTIEEYFTSHDYEKLNNFKKLLNIQFQYLVVDSMTVEQFFKRAYSLRGIDVIMSVKTVLASKLNWQFLYPYSYESISIVSPAADFMTPLEKISKFYGLWTLLSLTMILTVSFFVIWYKTRNFHLAAFDIIRLLINNDIVVPIDTYASKIFFSMIFLYFLIIHATFSGHLAEFLTSVDYRRNIDSIEDLKDSRIQTIYNLGHLYEKRNYFDVLKKKLKMISTSSSCKLIFNNTNSACIASLGDIERMVLKSNNINSFHVAKTSLGSLMSTNLYRPGFPLRDKFNWAFMYLYDTGITIKLYTKSHQMYKRKYEKNMVLNHCDFRNITFNDLLFGFLLLIIGNCIGLISFLFEIILYVTLKITKHRRRISPMT